MRDSKVGSICVKHKHLIGGDDLRSKDHKKLDQNRMEGTSSFVIKEIPTHRLLNAGQCANASSELSGFSKGKNFSAGTNVMDYDIPELVVFLLGDHHHHFVKDISIDRGVSTKGKCLIEDCEVDPYRISCHLDSNMKSKSDSNLGTMKTLSSNSNRLECASQSPCIKDAMKRYCLRNLMMERGEVELGSGNKNSIDHPTKTRTYETLREVFRKEADFSGSFKNWQMNSFLGTSGSSVEFSHCADHCQQFPESTRSMPRPEMWNSQTVTSSGPATTSGRALHQSNDSISSTHSFAFPILPAEWNGSPVRMLEADRSQSRMHQWLKICFPCCKC